MLGHAAPRDVVRPHRCLPHRWLRRARRSPAVAHRRGARRRVTELASSAAGEALAGPRPGPCRLPGRNRFSIADRQCLLPQRRTRLREPPGGGPHADPGSLVALATPRSAETDCPRLCRRATARSQQRFRLGQAPRLAAKGACQVAQAPWSGSGLILDRSRPSAELPAHLRNCGFRLGARGFCAMRRLPRLAGHRRLLNSGSSAGRRQHGVGPLAQRFRGLRQVAVCPPAARSPGVLPV
jgi:hypothetical protein